MNIILSYFHNNNNLCGEIALFNALGFIIIIILYNMYLFALRQSNCLLKTSFGSSKAFVVMLFLEHTIITLLLIPS